MISDEMRLQFDSVMKEIEKESEDYWNSLTKDEQLKVFCAIIRRIYQGEIIESRSYRGVLYGTFGFGLEAYVQAQMSGYLTIHNALYECEEAKDERKKNGQEF